MLEDLQQELEAVVGMNNLKEQLRLFCTCAAMGKIRRLRRIRTPMKRPVMVFRGNPGTGKTAVASIVARRCLPCNVMAHITVIVSVNCRWFYEESHLKPVMSHLHESYQELLTDCHSQVSYATPVWL